MFFQLKKRGLAWTALLLLLAGSGFAAEYDPSQDPTAWVPKGEERLNPEEIELGSEYDAIVWSFFVVFAIPGAGLFFWVRANRKRDDGTRDDEF